MRGHQLTYTRTLGLRRNIVNKPTLRHTKIHTQTKKAPTKPHPNTSLLVHLALNCKKHRLILRVALTDTTCLRLSLSYQGNVTLVLSI